MKILEKLFVLSGLLAILSLPMQAASQTFNFGVSWPTAYDHQTFTFSMNKVGTVNASISGLGGATGVVTVSGSSSYISINVTGSTGMSLSKTGSGGPIPASEVVQVTQVGYTWNPGAYVNTSVQFNW